MLKRPKVPRTLKIVARALASRLSSEPCSTQSLFTTEKYSPVAGNFTGGIEDDITRNLIGNSSPDDAVLRRSDWFNLNFYLCFNINGFSPNIFCYTESSRYVN